MKKLFYVFVLLAGSVSLYAAETVSSVSFNPSRMGDYTYLKVANKATLKGGLKTPEMNISVGGTISAEYSPNDSSRVYVINQLMGNPTSAIDMEQAVFHGNIAAQYTGYKSESSLLPAGLLPLMTIYGGNQTYLNDSYIQTLDAVNMLRQRAGELKSSALSVLGSGGGTASLYNGGSTYGLHLAGNDIPEPTGSHTNTGKDLSNCTLVWEKRKTSTTPAKEVWLLALKNCGTTPTPDPDPTPDPEPEPDPEPNPDPGPKPDPEPEPDSEPEPDPDAAPDQTPEERPSDDQQSSDQAPDKLPSTGDASTSAVVLLGMLLTGTVVAAVALAIRRRA